MVELTLHLDSRTLEKLQQYARRYRTSPSGMVQIITAYYFGGPFNHLNCEHCTFGTGETCTLPGIGEQTTMSLLDKGIVVVGLPVNEQEV